MSPHGHLNSLIDLLSLSHANMPKLGKKSARTLRQENRQKYLQRQSNKSNNTTDLQTTQTVDTGPEHIADLLVTEGHVRNSILHGTFHQGDESLGESAGKQCTCTSLVFMLEASIHPNLQFWTSEDLDEIVRHGTIIYDRIPNKKRNYLLIDELPTSASYHDDTFVLAKHQPFAGTIGRQITEEPFYSVLDALTETFRVASQAFLTIGDYTSGMVCSPLQNQGFYLFDSHSRDHAGYLCANGTSVCMQFMIIQEIAQYIGQLAQTMSNVGPQAAFEITPVNVFVEQTELSIHTHTSGQPINMPTAHDKPNVPQRIDGTSCSHWSDEADRGHRKKDTVAPTPSIHNKTTPGQSRRSPSARDRKKAMEKDHYWSSEVFRRKKMKANRLRIQTNPDCTETNRVRARLRIQTKPDCAETNRVRARLRFQTNPDCAETNRAHSRLRFQTSPECAETNRERARVRKHTHSQTLSNYMQSKRATNPTFRDRENSSRRKGYRLSKKVREKRQTAAKAAKIRAKADKSNIKNTIDDF